MHLTDPNGYGLRYEDIEEIEDKGWIIDPDALNKLIYKYNYQEDHYIDIPFLERLVDFVGILRRRKTAMHPKSSL